MSPHLSPRENAGHAGQEDAHAGSELAGASLAPPAFQLMASDATPPPPAQLKPSSNGLPGDMVQGFAASTGHDLSDVKVHHNSEKPGQVGALAYAQGNDIHLGAGQEQHLAHEAAHVVQQREGRVQANTEVNGMPVNDSKSLESEADAMGAKALQMKAESPGSLRSQRGQGPTQMMAIQRAVTPSAQNYKTYAELMAMTADSLDTYAQEQADWHASPSLGDTQRDEVRTILGFARQDGNLAGLTGMVVKDIQAQIAVLGKTLVFDRLTHYCQAAKQEPFQIKPTKVVADALDIGRSMALFKGAFPSWVLKTALPEYLFDWFRKNKFEPEVINYYKNSTPQPTFQADNGKDFLSYTQMRITDKKDPLTYSKGILAGHIRNFHRFEARVHEQLQKNYADTSKKKPLLLILHSGLDHNGAFHREKEFGDVVTNTSNNVLMVEGKPTMKELEAEIPVLAKKYGQNDKIDQVMVAGHGNANAIQVAGTISEDPTKHDIHEDAERISPDGNKLASESIMGTILDNMDKTSEKGPKAPHRRIQFNACLTNSHDLSKLSLDSDPAVARTEVKNYLKKPRNLVDWVHAQAAAKGSDGVTGVGSLSSFSQANYLNAAGQLDLISSLDPKMTASKIEYVKEGKEALGAMRCVIECWATDEKNCKQAMQDRVKAPLTTWDGVIIQELYSQVLNEYWDDADSINTMAPIAGTYAEMQQEAECRPAKAGSWPTITPGVVQKLFTALQGSDDWKSKSYLPLVMLQPWMVATQQSAADAVATKAVKDFSTTQAKGNKTKAEAKVVSQKAAVTEAAKLVQAAKEKKADADDAWFFKARKQAEAKTALDNALAVERQALVDLAKAEAALKDATDAQTKAEAELAAATAAIPSTNVAHTNKQAEFLTLLETSFDCASAKKYVDIDYLKANGLMTTLLAGAPSKGKLILALLGTITKNNAESKAYLVAQTVSDKFPDALKVTELLANQSTVDEVLIAIGKKTPPPSAKVSAPVVSTPTNTKANVTLKGGTQNTERIESVTLKAEPLADDTKAFQEPALTTEVSKFKKGVKLNVIGATSTVWAIEHKFTDTKKMGTAFIARADLKIV